MNVIEQDINVDHLKVLLDTLVETCYKVTESDPKAEGFVLNCLRLFEKDYNFSLINNDRGELCPHYPSSVVVINDEKGESTLQNDKGDGYIKQNIDPSELTELLQKSRFARYRTHFPVPVIHFEGKRICRSATVAESPENYRESDLEKFYHIRDLDLQVLKQYSIGYICDLMVEKVKVKYGIRVASSEKIDKDRRYADFNLCTIPYPGCEYFTDWRLNGYVGEGMMFDWTQKMVDAELELPENQKIVHSIDWTKYKNWDIIQLTQNYLKLFLHYIVKGDCGILMHCISGWHRTPMFISLLRLSLWADMAIHQSLGPLDILYLTVAYDWFLFGHNFQCLVKGEDIFVFCFHFLNYITSEEFSVSSFKSEQIEKIDCKIEKQLKREKSTDSEQDGTKKKILTKNNEKSSSTDLSPSGLINKSVPTPTYPDVSRGGHSSIGVKSDEVKKKTESEEWFREHDMFLVREESPRKQRLDAVRKIFLNNFIGANGQSIPESPEDFAKHFADKVNLSASQATKVQ